MGETVVLTAYMDPFKRDKYQSIYKSMKSNYKLAMKMLYGNKEANVETYRKELVDSFSTHYNYEYVDAGDVFATIEEETWEFREAQNLMEYNYHFSLLSTMYQMFEQQLRKFIYEELNHRLSPVRTDGEFADFGANMGKIKKAFKHVNYDLESNLYWHTIDTLADLVNAYKHGDGRSAKNLYKKHPEFFLQYHHTKERVMDRALTTNTEIVFDMKEANFDKFANTLIYFWDDFPEHLSGTYTFLDEKSKDN
ncbi:hypothetical protein [Priestia megaterium]|uniref:hypothetical protein n=1 Tax=Priestia megaterium TaxID=1404 RepID=UPI0025A466B7|nr:hypothetical protein [Priestia megaterium]MDM8151045.1 hypothetical protein [Priestia megaterium]